MSKEDKEPRTKVGNAVKSATYKVQKYIYEKAVEKRAQASKDLEARKEEYREASKKEGFFSDFKANSAEEKVARTRRGLERWDSVRYSLKDKVSDSKSATACLDRIKDEEYRYNSVGKLLVDRAIVEKFKPGGESTFDDKISPSKVYGLGGSQYVKDTLKMAALGEKLSEEDMMIVLAFGDAKLLTTPAEVAEDGSKVSLGEEIISSIEELREQERLKAKEEVGTKKELEDYKARDEQLGILQEQATIISTSAQEFYASWMQQLGSDQEQ